MPQIAVLVHVYAIVDEQPGSLEVVGPRGPVQRVIAAQVDSVDIVKDDVLHCAFATAL